MTKHEFARLQGIAENSLYSAGVMSQAIRHCARIFARSLAPGAILEMGPAEGLMTDELALLGRAVTVVEGAEVFCEQIKARHPHISVVNTLFESFEPLDTFGNIILGHVLEHVEDPVGLLRKIHRWLEPEGRVLAAVPNSRSLHRQAAVLMGLLPFEETLNDRDLHHGHRRVYNPETFRRDFLQAGYRIEQFGGYWLKPLSNGQLEQSWTPETVDAFLYLGERYPDVAGELYIVAS
jgi:2-polyprenyl-3-methyl-5-hydroxy-6-metoxy-1,4-benzoquinol methylase